jgi:hypothetical protein
VGGHRGQLDPGVLQQLLQPLDLPAAFSSDRHLAATLSDLTGHAVPTCCEIVLGWLR